MDCYITKNVVLDATGHSFGSWQNYNDAQHKHSCECGSFELSEHYWNEGVITTPPTAEVEGETTYSCVHCEATKIEKIPTTDVPEIDIRTPGDVNMDGKIDEADATLLMQYFAGWDVEIDETAMDINGDGALNNKDVSRLLQYIAGWNVEIF